MHLDMLTVSAANVAVTTVLGAVLLLTWARERESPLVGWWGLALLLQGAGVAMAASASPRNVDELVAIGTASIILGDAFKWKASREFAGRDTRLLWVLLGPVGFLLVVNAGYLQTFDDRLNAVCSVLALYNFAAAAELARANSEPLASRRPAVVLLVIAGIGFVSWMPLNAAMPIQEARYVLVSFWFPATILLTLLLRIALAFIVLSMAKERRELEQRAQALTDPLTGLPNRRALFEMADTLSQDRDLRSDAISVLIFDLDHFKQTNDRFGHDLGDRVLQLFAITAKAHLNGTSIVARLGGEEFVAILPDADPLAAANAAESVRRSFASAAASVDGLPVEGTVSVGVAWDAGVGGDLDALFRRADAALYMAKRAGRNRVELLGPDDANPLAEVEAAVRAVRRPWPADLSDLASAKLRA